ncbi:MAG TPA: hypothetical protein VIY48_07320 [Candidatus Paceibacterota bacterium]
MTTWLLVGACLMLACLAQVYRIQRDYFAEEVLNQYCWIDEIIEALESDE